MDKINNTRKGFCFITFEQEAVVQDLIRVGKTRIKDIEVDVKKATPKPDGGGRGGMRGGPRGGGRGMMRGDETRRAGLLFVSSFFFFFWLGWGWVSLVTGYSGVQEVVYADLRASAFPCFVCIHF